MKESFRFSLRHAAAPRCTPRRHRREKTPRVRPRIRPLRRAGVGGAADDGPGTAAARVDLHARGGTGTAVALASAVPTSLLPHPQQPRAHPRGSRPGPRTTSARPAPPPTAPQAPAPRPRPPPSAAQPCAIRPRPRTATPPCPPAPPAQKRPAPPAPSADRPAAPRPRSPCPRAAACIVILPRSAVRTRPRNRSPRLGRSSANRQAEPHSCLCGRTARAAGRSARRHTRGR